MDVFSHELNSSMMFKGQHPEYMIIVSLENCFSDFDDFWKNPFVLEHLSSQTIVVRLSEEQNQSDIQLFESIFHYSNIPSVFIFGKNQSSITKKWNDHFPTQQEFLEYFSETNSTNSEPSKEQTNTETPQSKIESTDPTSKSEPINSNSTTLSTQPVNNLTYTPLSPIESQNLIKRPPSKSQPTQKPSLIMTRSEANSNTISKNKNIARISVQGQNKTVKKEFPANSTIGELRSWIRSEFGRDLDLIIIHTHTPLPNDSSLTLQQADLYPSAVIRERDGGQAILKDDEDLSIGIVDRNVSSHSESSTIETRTEPILNNQRPNLPVHHDNSIWGAIQRYFKLLVSLLNPWDDDENETNDDFDNLWEYKPNPNYISGMLNQMYPNANDIPQDDWHPTRL